MRKTGAVTLKDVAEKAGVSTMTASVVLRGAVTHVKVSDNTRKRVEEAARQLQYRPNALARSLRSNRTDTFGFYSGYPYMGVENPFVYAILSGLMDGCNRNQKELLIYGDHRGQSVETICARLSDQRVDGLVIWTHPEDPLVERLASFSLPVAAVESALPALPSVVVDDVEGTRQIIRHLRDRGHRRAMHLTVGHQSTSRLRRQQTALDCAAAYGIEMRVYVEEGWLETWQKGEEIAYYDQVLDAWQASAPEERPTACFCWCDYAAFAFREKCLRRGLRVPEDLAIAGFDHLPPPRCFSGNLTSVYAPWTEVARTAIHILERQLAGEAVPAETVLPVNLVVGETT